MDYSAIARNTARRRQAIRDLRRVETPSIILRPETGGVTFQGRIAHLSPTMFLLVHALAREPGKMIKREVLMDVFSEDEEMAGERSLDYHLGRARSALHRAAPWAGDLAVNGPIRNVPGKGWYWVEINSDGIEEKPSPEEEAEIAEAEAAFEGLTAEQSRFVWASRQGMIPMHIARDFMVPLPRVIAALSKARHLGISTHPENDDAQE